MLSSEEVAIYCSYVRVWTVVGDMSHCLASVTDNVGAAVALVPQLFAGPARQSLVLIVLLHGLNVLLRIHVLTAQVRRLSGLTESSLAGCSVHRDNLICRNTLFLTKPP